jgi:hypothetical protein
MVPDSYRNYSHAAKGNICVLQICQVVRNKKPHGISKGMEIGCMLGAEDLAK